ncbi:MAG: hypothetical protein PHO07_21725 [Pirellulales bacterium]|jgi:hypothetical protein|nr:hypothetical protein [Thermoguttaceae bacterium]MDD4789796.1 hypothetical protein [Pirellulales bacterium]NLZ03360.1 hypothetical protein [Pirellulaceae bacterium]
MIQRENSLRLPPGAAAKRHRASLKSPPKTVDEHLGALANRRLPETVRRLRSFEELI